MKALTLDNNHYLNVSPLGAYYAVSMNKQQPLFSVLRHLLQQTSTPLLTQSLIDTWQSQYGTEFPDTDYLAQLNYALERKLLTTASEPQTTTTDSLGDVLPTLLPKLVDSGQALLADEEGFCLESCGFGDKSGDNLAALSADIATLHERHMETLQQHFSLSSSAWGIINPNGNSQIGFWPIFIGTHRFVLVMKGKPQLNQTALIDLIRALSIRYT